MYSRSQKGGQGGFASKSVEMGYFVVLFSEQIQGAAMREKSIAGPDDGFEARRYRGTLTVGKGINSTKRWEGDEEGGGGGEGDL